MTDGEKMIWAAVFAMHWKREFRGLDEDGCLSRASDAAEEATSAVEILRRAGDMVLSEYGDEDGVYDMLSEMVEMSTSK